MVLLTKGVESEEISDALIFSWYAQKGDCRFYFGLEMLNVTKETLTAELDVARYVWSKWVERRSFFSEWVDPLFNE